TGKTVRKSLQNSDKVPTKFQRAVMFKEIKHIYEFDGFCLDATERVLFKEGELVPLTPKAIETLIVLVENNGHVVEKDDLMKAVWRDTFVNEDSLTRNISVLRKVLSQDSADGQYIETLARRGYRFQAVVTEHWEKPEFIVSRHASLRITHEVEETS